MMSRFKLLYKIIIIWIITIIGIIMSLIWLFIQWKVDFIRNILILFLIFILIITTIIYHPIIIIITRLLLYFRHILRLRRFQFNRNKLLIKLIKLFIILYCIYHTWYFIFILVIYNCIIIYSIITFIFIYITWS
jgi:hypothetical protein